MDKILNVNVPRATILIVRESNPYEILVGDKEKVDKYVLPGGKLDLEKGGVNLEAAQTAIKREAFEETGAHLTECRFLKQFTALILNSRVVHASKLNGIMTDPKLPKTLPSDSLVLAHYGRPDYIFIGAVKEAQLAQNTEELRNIRFIDIRRVSFGNKFASGHDEVVKSYRSWLEGRAEIGCLNGFSTRKLERFPLLTS